MNKSLSDNLFERIPDALVVHDPETGEILDANEAYLAMHGYTREELVGRTVAHISADDPAYSMDRAQEYLQRAREEGSVQCEWQNRHKSGEEFPVEAHLTLVVADGEERVLASVRDITERKEHQEELRRQNERLEQFAGVLGHDLRNPLNVAQLHLQQVDDEDVTPVRESLDRMEVIIDDVLALARKGQRVDETEPIPLSTVAHTAWNQVETGRGSLTVTDDCTIEADAGRCQQLFENLFRNAVEHGSTGSQSGTDDAVEHGSTSSRTGSDDSIEHADSAVTVRVGCTPAGFYVEDDGPGIPEDDCPDVFETGYTTTDGGTGLGLSIVQAIAEAHGWTVDVTESSDGGARFLFGPLTAEHPSQCRT